MKPKLLCPDYCPHIRIDHTYADYYDHAGVQICEPDECGFSVCSTCGERSMYCECNNDNSIMENQK